MGDEIINIEPFRQILTKYWGFTSFKPLQEEIIRSVARGMDTLGLMPTGGGKSVTFQVPALEKEGICLVVTPLIALMKDQVARLNNMGIKSVAIHSGMSAEEIDITLDNCIYGDYKFLYISPERIPTRIFQSRLQRLNLNLVTIDEAHCISQWGYDFRPSYLKIASVRELISDKVPFLALTATATEQVIADILERLEFGEKNVLRTSFERKNISYFVRQVEDKGEYLVKTLHKIRGSGIIYVRSRKRCREVAELLVSKGISADFYHAGLTPELRDRKQMSWTSGETRVIVATNAFGMGIDKAEVRFVIHWDIPDSIEEYFQESGRAGRDGKPAYAVLLYSPSDRKRLEDSVRKKFPPVEKIKDVYEALCNFLNVPLGSGKDIVFDFNMADFVSKYRLPVIETYNSLNFLQREGYVEFTEEINNPSRVHFIVGRDDLYKFQVANEAFDSFIKLLLRSYTGMFSEFVVISEDALAKKAALTRDAVYNYLVKLSGLNIIRYIPGKKTSLVIFTEERLDRKSLFISPANYLQVKERYIIRVNKMIDYADYDTRCRSVTLLDYFGEEADRCGICDVCRRRNELDLSKYEFDLILEEIKDILAVQKLDARELVSRVSQPEEKVVKVIRWLLDHRKLIMDEKHLLSWKERDLFSR
ncbi:MAG TPA: ATP-dependent DNA helicase RecQ [Bacteroidales bacterium]|nr:ATP-dependent DNA helicase RecQ [Bacteroidales bacterium]HPF03158.1 ATP-dependent DNA helicase RecQ [Bacteroidales bacterium]HPJ59480.1 ATP-dependent DNA helicase RecQ [Bacteroidales bacterium]HPR12863.1 ATP-dependent DNA helicase RecQ [Bacteroidales bacterium]HRW85110.1 ATP-dependent DNA helicase RecQ [Bacteroidales bacterium]